MKQRTGLHRVVLFWLLAGIVIMVTRELEIVQEFATIYGTQTTMLFVVIVWSAYLILQRLDTIQPQPDPDRALRNAVRDARKWGMTPAEIRDIVVSEIKNELSNQSKEEARNKLQDV